MSSTRFVSALSLVLSLSGLGCSGSLDARPDGGSTIRSDAGPLPDGHVASDAQIDVDASTAACTSVMPPASSALAFDGRDDHVTMGVARPLGLAQLTLEAWVRRDGAGIATGTGVGGLTLVPIVAKGRGEDDGSNVDCNYAFGFFGDVLGADFEDMASGANHPVIGR